MKAQIEAICGHCNGQPVTVVYNSRRLVVRCDFCGRKLYGYYVDRLALADEVLGVLRAYQAEKGYMPTTREVARALGVGTGTVSLSMGLLWEAGKLEGERGGPRAFRLVESEEVGDVGEAA